VGRRRFDQLWVELSVALGQRVPRYALWLRMHEHGWDPEDLSREGALAFCGAPLSGFLWERGLALGPRTRRRLERSVARFDPNVPTPCEVFARL
jgi:hypothetical protein